MTSQILSKPATKEAPFETENVLTIVGGHFVHDTYSAFLPMLLVELQEKLSLSLTMVGFLTMLSQLPAILNPFIGYLADKISVRYFIIFAPAVTATMISLLGNAPNQTATIVLLVMMGISSAAFHAPAPAMIARISGKNVGRGMSWFMAGGELGRTIGPLIVVAGIGIWGFDGIYRLLIIGWAASLLLLWRFRTVSSKSEQKKPGNFFDTLPQYMAFFLPMFFIVVPRAFLATSITRFMPIFMRGEGASLVFAGISLSVLEGAGVVGALISGSVSDRVGRKPTLIIAMVCATVTTGLFLLAQGWLLIPALILLGFFSLSTQPVLLALVQDHHPESRATANGLFMFISFLGMSLSSLLVGMAGDAWGLRTTFLIGAMIALVTIPAILALPKEPQTA
ncbi:MAG: MFS transporter [Anaerolineales bacterium]|nr:MFS transporter [Anaerolineales bacterium]